MSPGSIVRPALAGDSAAIARIYSASALAHDSTMDTRPVSVDEVAAWLDRLQERETLLVAVEDDDVRGWGIVRRYSDRPGYAFACETSVYLDRAHLGRGIGSLLQDHLMRFCRAAGYHHVVAKIWADNEASVALHRKFGFTLVGIQREIGLVASLRRDVAIYQCLLDS